MADDAIQQALEKALWAIHRDPMVEEGGVAPDGYANWTEYEAAIGAPILRECLQPGGDVDRLIARVADDAIRRAAERIDGMYLPLFTFAKKTPDSGAAESGATPETRKAARIEQVQVILRECLQPQHA